MDRNLTGPSFGLREPLYPPLIQFVKVTGGTVSGNIYPCATQQSNGNTGSSRDRENAWVWEPNGNVLITGYYYICRLIGSYTSGGNTYPLYETTAFGGGSGSGGGGILNIKSYTPTLPAFTVSGATNNILTMNAVGVLAFSGWSSFNAGDLILYDPSALGSGSPSSNGGVYSVTTPGDGSTQAVLTRTTYDLTINKLNIGRTSNVPGTGIPLKQPLQPTNGFPYTIIELNTPDPITYGTTPLQFGFTSSYVPGATKIVDGYTTSLDPYTRSQTSTPNDTYTRTGNGALTVDGTALTVGQTLLFNPGSSDGGWFKVTATGSGGAPWVIQRTDDTNTTIPGFIQSSTPTIIRSGTFFKNSVATVLTADPITIGTTSLSIGDPIRGGCCNIPVDAYTTSLVDTYTKSQTVTPNDTYTKSSNGAITNFDGVTMSVGSTILFNPGTADGGWFKVNAVGSGGAPWVIQRINKTNTTTSGEITSGTLTPIRPGGTTYGGKIAILTTADPIIIGTTALTYAFTPDVSSLTSNSTVAADQTTTSSTQTDVTGLSFAIGANEVWTGEADMYATGPVAGTGITFSLTGPSSPTNVRIFTIGDTTGVTSVSTDSQTAFSTPTQAYITGAFSGLVTIRFTIENGANAGTVQLQFASNTNGQSNKILRGSFMTARKVK